MSLSLILWYNIPLSYLKINSLSFDHFSSYNKRKIMNEKHRGYGGKNCIKSNQTVFLDKTIFSLPKFQTLDILSMYEISSIQCILLNEPYKYNHRKINNIY